MTQLFQKENLQGQVGTHFFQKKKTKEALVTYDMNILQSLPTTEPFCVSLNQQIY